MFDLKSISYLTKYNEYKSFGHAMAVFLNWCLFWNFSFAIDKGMSLMSFPSAYFIFLLISIKAHT